MLNIGIGDAFLMGLNSSSGGIWGGPHKRGKNGQEKEMLKLIMIEVKQGFVWG